MLDKIPYTYKVLEVQDWSMTVEYSNPTYGTMLVGVRLPRGNETLESVIDAANPTIYWRESEAPLVPVNVGDEGSGEAIAYPTSVIDTRTQTNINIANAPSKGFGGPTMKEIVR